MNTLTKQLYQYINTFLSIARIIVTGVPQKVTQQKKDSKVISILGTGPSLRNVSIKDLSGSKIAVNYFANTSSYEIACPDYYVIVAPEFWAKDAHSGTKVKVQALLDRLIETTHWPMELFVPYSSGDFFTKQLQGNPSITVRKIMVTPLEGIDRVIFKLFDQQMGMPRPHNVLIPSLMIAIWRGYSQINLYGVDHSWLPLIFVDEENNALLEQKHFYDKGKTKPQKMRKDAQFKEGRKLHEMLEKFYLTFRAYHIIQRYATKKSVKINNCTPGSFIDAFERKPYLGQGEN